MADSAGSLLSWPTRRSIGCGPRPVAAGAAIGMLRFGGAHGPGGRRARIRSVLARRGALGFASSVLRRLRRRLLLCETHIWYELCVAHANPVGSLEPLRLVRATSDQVDLVEQLGQSGPVARAHHADGHDLWLVLDSGVAVFACWTFRGRTPVAAHRAGWLPLPVGTRCLEDAVVAPSCRGKAIAPRAWAAVAEHLSAESVEHLIAKVEVGNAASRRAVVKIGFREVARQRFERRGRQERVAVDVVDCQRRGRVLRDVLAR